MIAKNPPLAITAIAHAALFLLLIPAALIDATEILGVSRWVKPMKFAISIAIFSGTMMWLLGYLQESSRAVRRVSWTIAIAMSGEMFLIAMQAARGVRSHFNNQSAFDGAVFAVMGVLIIANTAAAIYAAWLFFRRPVSISGATLAGVRLGLIMFIIASLEGGIMIARGSHSVGIHDGSPGLPFVNWNSGAGDLRVAHFAGMHALQGLPLLGLLLDRRKIRGGAQWVAGIAGMWLIVTKLLVMQALAGRPLLAMG